MEYCGISLGCGCGVLRGLGAMVEGSIKTSLPLTGGGYSFTGFKAADLHWAFSMCLFTWKAEFSDGARKG